VSGQQQPHLRRFDTEAVQSIGVHVQPGDHLSRGEVTVEPEREHAGQPEVLGDALAEHGPPLIMGQVHRLTELPNTIEKAAGRAQDADTSDASADKEKAAKNPAQTPAQTPAQKTAKRTTKKAAKK
jgi:hypothetical protein